MTSRESTLSLVLEDDVSRPAKTVAEALEQAETRVREIAAAMSETGASDRLVSSLAKIGASASDVEAVSKAWKSYSENAGLAADRTDWTRADAAAVRALEPPQSAR